VIATLGVALRFMPAGPASRSPQSEAGPPPRWDIPARMAVATSLVVLLTAVAPTLGPRLTGLLTPFPLYAAILAVFAHHREGPRAAVGVLRGLLLGLFAFATFFLALAVLLERVGVAAAFAGAVTLGLTVQAGSLLALGRSTG
jgi:uncharacterized membrane protein (GlpM family)